MFDLWGSVPDDWEPIPDAVLAEIGGYDERDVAGMYPAITIGVSLRHGDP